MNVLLANEDRQLLHLTEQQFRVLDYLKRQRRVSITGGAGTGKTLLALEKAKRLAAEGFNTLLTCFNRPLADHLRRCAGDVERLIILNFHQLCWHLAGKAGIPMPHGGPESLPSQFFVNDAPNAMLQALDRIADRFDAIVVDEGQDFYDSWWDPLQFCLADPEQGVLYVFHDENQQVYHRALSFPPNLVDVPLEENLRNTQRIHAAASGFYGGQPLRAVGPEGRDVEIVAVESREGVARAVASVLQRLVITERVPAADVAVLLGSSRSTVFEKEADHIGAVPVTKDQVKEPSKVLLETVRRFKGLERPVVVLAGIDELLPEDEKCLLYVALTRARVYLAVVATAHTLDRLGLPSAAK